MTFYDKLIAKVKLYCVLLQKHIFIIFIYIYFIIVKMDILLLIGTSLVPKTLSARIILFLFSLCCLFFYTSYSANIVALLQSSSATFRSLSDLTNSPLGIGIQDVIYNKIFFGVCIYIDIRFYNHEVNEIIIYLNHDANIALLENAKFNLICVFFRKPLTRT